MKNDNHVWDNKNPTAQMLGRWQPWHAGHQKLFEETLKKTGQVNIMVRDVKGVDDNPSHGGGDRQEGGHSFSRAHSLICRGTVLYELVDPLPPECMWGHYFVD